MSEKRISIRLEFSLHGKRKKPSVSFISDGTYGIPLTSRGASEEENAAFSAFSNAAHEFCKKMVEAGELK